MSDLPSVYKLVYTYGTCQQQWQLYHKGMLDGKMLQLTTSVCMISNAPAQRSSRQTSTSIKFLAICFCRWADWDLATVWLQCECHPGPTMVTWTGHLHKNSSIEIEHHENCPIKHSYGHTCSKDARAHTYTQRQVQRLFHIPIDCVSYRQHCRLGAMHFHRHWYRQTKGSVRTQKP